MESQSDTSTGGLVPVIQLLGQEDERRLREHAEERVEGNVSERQRDDELVEHRREEEREQHRHALRNALAQQRIV